MKKGITAVSNFSILFFIFYISIFYLLLFFMFTIKDNLIFIRCFIPTEKEYNKYFKQEFSKIWVNMSNVVEILYLNVKENKDGRGKVIYYFEKAKK